MSVEIYRLLINSGSSNSSSSQMTIFSDRQAFERRLFEAAMEAEARDHSRTEDPQRRSFMREWFRGRMDKKIDPLRGINKVVRVEHLVNGEWVPLTWRIDPPRLVLGTA